MRSMDWVDITLRVAPILVSLFSLGYTIYKNRETKKLQDEVKRVQLDVLKASEIYGQVKFAKRLYEDSLSELCVLSVEEVPPAEFKKCFLTAYNRYTDFFNEINDYCIMVNAGAIEAEEYIKNTVSINFSKYAKKQYETFTVLQALAEKHGFDKLQKPDYKSFKEYDEFLIKYNGENSAFWSELKTKRIEVGFE